MNGRGRVVWRISMVTALIAIVSMAAWHPGAAAAISVAFIIGIIIGVVACFTALDDWMFGGGQ